MRRQHRMANHHCRLRKYRKSVHVSQRELASLIGLHSQGALSEIESGRKRPALEPALACAVTFGVPVEDLFPGLAAHVKQEVLARARRLHADLAPRKNRTAATVGLAALISRLGGANP